MRNFSVITGKCKTAVFAANYKRECEAEPLLIYKPHTPQHTTSITLPTYHQ